MNPFVASSALGFVTILLSLIWLACRPLPEGTLRDASDKIEDLLSLHIQHLPQLPQLLAGADSQHVRRDASKETERIWLEERRQILRSYLICVAQDFARLEHFACVVASLDRGLPGRRYLSHPRLRLSIRLNYRIAWIRISTGGVGPNQHIVRLTDLIGDLSAKVEAAMNRLEPTSPAERLDSNLNA